MSYRRSRWRRNSSNWSWTSSRYRQVLQRRHSARTKAMSCLHWLVWSSEHSQYNNKRFGFWMINDSKSSRWGWKTYRTAEASSHQEEENIREVLTLQQGLSPLNWISIDQNQMDSSVGSWTARIFINNSSLDPVWSFPLCSLIWLISPLHSCSSRLHRCSSSRLFRNQLRDFHLLSVSLHSAEPLKKSFISESSFMLKKLFRSAAFRIYRPRIFYQLNERTWGRRRQENRFKNAHTHFKLAPQSLINYFFMRIPRLFFRSPCASPFAPRHSTVPHFPANLSHAKTTTGWKRASWYFRHYGDVTSTKTI